MVDPYISLMIGGIFIFKRCVGIIICITVLLSSCSMNKSNIDYKLGRNPFSSFINLSGDEVMFKSFVLYKGGDSNELEEYRYQGLFKKINSNDEPELIYEDFSHGLNVYEDKLYFINTQHQLLEYDTLTTDISVLAGDDLLPVSECLIINDTLYYILENTTENTGTLYAYDLIQGTIKVISDNVYWERLNHFNDKLQFWDQSGNVKIFESASDKIIEYGPFDMEVIQILDNKKVIGYKSGTFYQCDLDGGNEKSLFSVKDLYNIVVTQNEIFYSTVDKETYTQLFRYTFSTKKIEKITTTEFPIVGFAGAFIYCASSTGIGDLQRIDANTGDREAFDNRARGSYVQKNETVTGIINDSDIDAAKKAVISYYQNTAFKNDVVDISKIEDSSKFESSVILHRAKDMVIGFYVTMSDRSKRMIVLTKEMEGTWEVINEGV